MPEHLLPLADRRRPGRRLGAEPQERLHPELVSALSKSGGRDLGKTRLDLEPLLVYRLNPFSIFYVGSTYGSRQFDGYGLVGTDRQHFAKFQYLFRP